MNDQMLEYVYTGRDAFHHAHHVQRRVGLHPAVLHPPGALTEKRPVPDELVTTLETNRLPLPDRARRLLRNTAAPTHDWLRRELARGRLAFLRRFDTTSAATGCFAVTRNVPDWPTMHDVEHDDAGRTSDEELAAMLAGKPTYSGSAIVHVDVPAYDADVHVPFRVAGWALAPDGIRSVDILFESGRVRVPADLVERGDVKALYPWYPRVRSQASRRSSTNAPAASAPDTDMSIEITDKRRPQSAIAGSDHSLAVALAWTVDRRQ